MIDYSAFEEKNVKQYNGKLPGLPKIASPFAAFGIVSFFLIVIILMLVSPVSRPLSLLLIVISLFVAHRLTWNGRESSIRSALFAKRNGFNYSWKGGKFTALEGMGSILGEPMMSNVVSGQINGQKFTVSGVYTHKLFKNVMRVTLPNKYPHIILDAKQNDYIVSSLQKIFPESKEIVLEGDFPSYFRVFTATSPVETLQILSPELMARMIDYTHRADIEILEDQLLLICNFKFTDVTIYQMFFEATEQILKDIGASANNSRVKFDSNSRI